MTPFGGTEPSGRRKAAMGHEEGRAPLSERASISSPNRDRPVHSSSPIIRVNRASEGSTLYRPPQSELEASLFPSLSDGTDNPLHLKKKRR